METIKVFYKYWINDGWYYGAVIGGIVGPFIYIRNNFAGRRINEESVSLTTALSMVEGGSTGSLLGATFPFWLPYGLFAQCCYMIGKHQNNIVRRDHRENTIGNVTNVSNVSNVTSVSDVNGGKYDY